MTQSLVSTQLRPVFREDTSAATCPASGNTVVSTMILQNVIEHLMVSLVVAVHAIDAFIVEVQFTPNGDWVTLTNAVTATPAGLILAASGTLASQGVGTGWFLMDARGLYGVRLSASGTVDDTTTVAIHAGGS